MVEILNRYFVCLQIEDINYISKKVQPSVANKSDELKVINNSREKGLKAVKSQEPNGLLLGNCRNGGCTGSVFQNFTDSGIVSVVEH